MVRTLRYSLWLVLLIGVAGWCPLLSQQQQPQPQQQQLPSQQPQAQQPQDTSTQPIPAGRIGLGGVTGSGDVGGNTVPQDLKPDTHSLVGAQKLSLGIGHSFWQPFFDVSSTFISTPPSSSTPAEWSTWTSLLADVDLHKISGTSNLTLSYLGIGSLSNAGSSSDEITQQLGVSERFTWHRSVMSLLDQVGYYPLAGFGYGQFGVSTVPIAGSYGSLGSVGFQSSFAPDQSILTASRRSLSNAAAIEINTYLTPRKSLTLVGGDNLLHYFSNSLFDTNEVIFQGGYNDVLTRKDTIALFYRFDGFRYNHVSPLSQSIDSHSVQFSYARRVTGRLSFQVAAGPSVAFSRIPIPTSTSSSSGASSLATTASSSRQFFWGVNTTLDYQLRRTHLALEYNHGVTAGSGVLFGSISDNASFNADRQFTRRTNGVLTAGYSRNTGLAVTPTSSATSSPTGTEQTFNYWFGGANLIRQLGRSINLSVGYQVQFQNSNTAFCAATCGTNFLQHMAILELGWHPRAFNLGE